MQFRWGHAISGIHPRSVAIAWIITRTTCSDESYTYIERCQLLPRHPNLYLFLRAHYWIADSPVTILNTIPPRLSRTDTDPLRASPGKQIVPERVYISAKKDRARIFDFGQRKNSSYLFPIFLCKITKPIICCINPVYCLLCFGRRWAVFLLLRIIVFIQTSIGE